MNFAEAIRACLERYATFRGRARRSEYWYFVLFCILTDVAFRIGAILLTTLHLYQLAVPYLILDLLVGLGLVLPQLTAQVRRLHDSARSGWWVVGGVLSAFVLTGFVKFHLADGLPDGLTVLTVLSTIGYLIWFIALLATKGTVGPNRFGPDPVTELDTAPAA